ncbi:MAG: glycosyltransferase [Rubrivivax sp.]
MTLPVAPALAAAPIPLLVLLPTLRAGGSERVLLTLLRHLDRTRFRPLLAVVNGQPPELAADLPDDVPWVDLRCERVARAGPALWRLVRERRPRIVFSTLSHLNLMVAFLRPLMPRGTRFVARESNVLSHSLADERRPALLRLAHRLLYPRFDLIVCQSCAMQDDLCLRFGVRRASTRVIPNPVDLERVRRLADEPIAADPASHSHATVRLVAAGRLAPQKNFAALLDAIALCRDLPLRLDLIGQGPEQDRLHARVAQLGLADRVALQPFTPNPYPWLRRADALLLSSLYEGLPNVVIEALALGTPVVTTPVPAAVEIVQAIPGCVVADDFSPEALARAIRAWFAGPRARIDDAAMATYAAGAVARRYEQALADVAVV